MKTSRAFMVAGGSAAILSAGWVVSPKELPSLDLVAPSDEPVDDGTEYVEGPTVLTHRGPVQVGLTIADGEITWISIVQGNSPNPYTINIYSKALPVLRERVLTAQDWDIEYASGASYLSPGFVESVRGAMVSAGLTEDGQPVQQPGQGDDGRADYDREAPTRPNFYPFSEFAPDLDGGDTEEPDAQAADGTFTGPAVSNSKGTYQLAIVVEGGEVVDVEFLQAGTSAATSVSVNGFALPELEARILEAQDWDVEHVSGASFTSPAMVESARGAFEDAGLA